MSSEYISRKVLDQYFDRFTVKLVRLHERMQKIIAMHDKDIEKINHILSGHSSEIVDLVESSNDDCRRLDEIENKG